MNRLRVFGAGIRAAIVADIVSWQFADRYRIDGFYDDRLVRGSEGPAGARVLGTVADGLDELELDPECHAFVALGTRASAIGFGLLCEMERRGITVGSLVCDDAFVSPSATIGINALICPSAFIGSYVRIGKLATIHGGASIEHHGVLGDNVLIAPGVATAGAAVVGSHTFIGVGASVLPEAVIGHGVIVGGGAVVRGVIPSHSVIVGAPARVLRETAHGDEVPTREQLAELALDDSRITRKR